MLAQGEVLSPEQKLRPSSSIAEQGATDARDCDAYTSSHECSLDARLWKPTKEDVNLLQYSVQKTSPARLSILLSFLFILLQAKCIYSLTKHTSPHLCDALAKLMTSFSPLAYPRQSLFGLCLTMHTPSRYGITLGIPHILYHGPVFDCVPTPLWQRRTHPLWCRDHTIPSTATTIM